MARSSGYQAPQLKLPGPSEKPSEAAKATRPTTRTTRRGFHSNIFPPEHMDARHVGFSATPAPG